MKKFKSLAGIFSALLIALVGAVTLTGCPGTEATGEEYTISADTTATVGPGDEVTINVTTNGTMLAPVSSDSNVATATVDNDADTITITGSSSVTAVSTATITVTLSEDEEKTLEITVTVNPAEAAKYLLTITLDEKVAASASSVVVTYAGQEGDETDYETYTATATVTEGTDNVTWTAELVEAYANSWNWFNNITVAVYGEDGNPIDEEIEIDITNFEYTTEGVTITVSVYESSTTSLTITLTGFETAPVAGTVTYANAEDSTAEGYAEETVDMVIAADGASATVEISSDYCNSNKWFYISEIKLYSDAEKATEITGFEATYDKWQDFTAVKAVTLAVEDTSISYSFPYTSDTITVASQGYTKVLPASAFADLTIASVTITVSTATDSVTWASVCAASTYDSTVYNSVTLGTASEITSETFISALKTNGLYIQTPAGDFTVTVDYSETAAATATKTINSLSVTVANGWSSYSTDGSVIAASNFADLEITQIDITVTPGDGWTTATDDSFGAGYGTTWACNCTGSDGVYTGTITDSSKIAGIQESGLGFGGNSYGSATVSLTITYKTSDSSEETSN